jgi:protein phosphatase
VLLIILGGGLWAGWRVTQHQFYVGATEEGQLAVFRGVPGQIAGVDLSSVQSTSATKVDDLTSVAQERVKQGIQADSEADAQRRLAELTTEDPTNPNLKPACPPTPVADPTGTPTEPPVNPTATPSGVASTTGIGAATSSASGPDVPPTDTVPPVIDPADCRPSD